MHGYADYTSALLWVMADTAGPIDISWRPDAAGRRAQLTLDASATSGNVVLARLTGLAPGKAVPYRVTGDGDSRDGTLTAQPYWSEARGGARSRHRVWLVLLSGRSRSDLGRTGLTAAASRSSMPSPRMKPDLMIWVGDNLYFQDSDELDPAAMAMRYRRQRTFAPLQKLLTAAPHLAIWDDHDYGPNDADMSYVMKGESLQLFRRYWANPSYGLPDVPGVFGRAAGATSTSSCWTTAGTAPPIARVDGPGKTMFGAQQLAWLQQCAHLLAGADRSSCVNGNQMWNRVNRFEGWNHFASEQTGVRGLAARAEDRRRRVPVRRPSFQRTAEE